METGLHVIVGSVCLSVGQSLGTLYSDPIPTATLTLISGFLFIRSLMVSSTFTPSTSSTMTPSWVTFWLMWTEDLQLRSRMGMFSWGVAVPRVASTRVS